MLCGVQHLQLTRLRDSESLLRLGSKALLRAMLVDVSAIYESRASVRWVGIGCLCNHYS